MVTKYVPLLKPFKSKVELLFNVIGYPKNIIINQEGTILIVNSVFDFWHMDLALENND